MKQQLTLKTEPDSLTRHSRAHRLQTPSTPLACIDKQQKQKHTKGNTISGGMCVEWPIEFVGTYCYNGRASCPAILYASLGVTVHLL